MKPRRPHLLSYLAALAIGIILFAMVWHSLFGRASRPVVIAGVAGVLVAVIVYLIVTNKQGPPPDP